MKHADRRLRYDTLGREDFDAIVTGELTHYAVWLELALETAIENYFALPEDKREQFGRLILQRDGMTFQTKIELVRSIVRQDEFEEGYRNAWNEALKKIEDIKRLRNAMAHGKDNGGEGLVLKIGLVNRAGKEVEIEINPEIHQKNLADAEALQEDVFKLARLMRKSAVRP